MVKNLKNSILYKKLKPTIVELKIRKEGEANYVSKIYEEKIGKKIDLNNPKGLDEKIVWLKINYFQDFFIKCCDKYLIHEYLKEKLGKDMAPELLFYTKNVNELSLEKITKFPCIIKVSNGSGANLIVHNKNEFSNEYLQEYFSKKILEANIHNVETREHQYLKKNPYLVVENLIQNAKGEIPNDYKFLYANGSLLFIYCSVDRMGSNVRQVYDKDWNRQHFIWVDGANEDLFNKYDSSQSIDKPIHFDEMINIAGELAKDFPLVRVDFYETEEKIYIGEITLHHGSGYDKFYPEKYDVIYGEKLVLPKANR